MSKRDRQFWVSAKMNNALARNYYDHLLELSISMFEWKNLPETVDERFLELSLFTDGKALFFRDEVIGELALRCTAGGRLSVYNIPMQRNAYASNNYHADRTDKDSVIIYNNLIHTNTLPLVESYALRLWNLDRICDINCNAQKTPLLITCDENLRLTMMQVYEKYEGNEPVIFGDNKLNPNSIQVMNTDAPFIADKVYAYKCDLWNECLEKLGIDNNKNEKKERMITDEIKHSEGGTIASRFSRLRARQMACDEINTMFGLNISVDFREELQTNIDDTEGENDEQIHNGSKIHSGNNERKD